MSVCRIEGDRGFTLIEVMVVVAIAGIIAALAVANLQPQINRSRTKSAARQLRADLQKAKLEAIKRNTSCLVDFTPAAGGNAGSCRTCISTDDDCDDAGVDIMISQLDFNDYPNTTLENIALTGGAQEFVFNARGLPETTAGANAAGSVDINCTTDAAYLLKLSFAMGGRIRIE